MDEVSPVQEYLDNLYIPVWFIVIICLIGFCALTFFNILIFKTLFPKKTYKKGKEEPSQEEDESEVIDTDDQYSDSESEDSITEDNSMGKLQYSLFYDKQNQLLRVNVIRGIIYPLSNNKDMPDPYIKVYISSRLKNTKKSKIVYDSFEPVFGENMKFEKIDDKIILDEKLTLAMYDYNQFSKHELIGKIELKLNSCYDECIENKWESILSSESFPKTLSEISLEMKYVPTESEMTIKIIQAINLQTNSIGAQPDTIVEIIHLEDNIQQNSLKTRMIKKSENPYYNQSFIINVPLKKIPKTKVMIVVKSYKGVIKKKSKTLGYVDLSSTSSKEQLRHWTVMLKNPRQVITQKHVLKH